MVSPAGTTIVCPLPNAVVEHEAITLLLIKIRAQAMAFVGLAAPVLVILNKQSFVAVYVPLFVVLASVFKSILKKFP